jgi:hypothetical protein
MEDLTNVNVSNISDEDILAWDSTTSEWVNVAQSGGGGSPGGNDGDIQINDNGSFGALSPESVSTSGVNISNDNSVSDFDCDSTSVDETADYVAQVDKKLDEVITALQNLGIFN